VNGIPKYIFDFGAHVGENLEYYLSRADKVVAVEANPYLCSIIKNKFNSEVIDGKLLVENVALTDSSVSPESEVDFFVNIEASVKSQIGEPLKIEDFSRISVKSMPASNIVRKYLSQDNDPFYVKIDLEYHDSVVLMDLFRHNIFPDFISAESHTIETFAALVSSGKYNSFALVPGKKVHLYKWGSKSGDFYNFNKSSAGPFGGDISTDWYDVNTFYQVLYLEKLGWKDIHASKNNLASLKKIKSTYILRNEFLHLLTTLYRLLVPLTMRLRIAQLKRSLLKQA
jgi:FkbM family methyltransferase